MLLTIRFPIGKGNYPFDGAIYIRPDGSDIIGNMNGVFSLFLSSILLQLVPGFFGLPLLVAPDKNCHRAKHEGQGQNQHSRYVQKAGHLVSLLEKSAGC